jgi:methionyl-tRNA formyltransferase
MFGTGPFAAPTFRALYETSHQVVALVTQPPRVVRGKVVAADSPLRDEAVRRGTPILDPEDINTAESQSRLAECDAELFVVADYGQILSAETLGLARHGAINLHGSLLPKYRGAAPINWALYKGETETGVSVIHMTPRIDAGPVLAQAKLTIDPDETAVELETRLCELGAPLVCHVIEAIVAGSTASLPQDLALATKARRLRKTDGAIDWSRTPAEIKNQVRALQPWPRAYTDWLRTSGSPLRLIIGQAQAVEYMQPSTSSRAKDAEPGEVLVADKQNFFIASGHGAVAILRIQPAGRQMMSAADFLHGHPIRVGDRLGLAEEPAA